VYTSPPQYFDHELVAGDTYQAAVVTLLDGAGAAYDLTGVTGLAELRERVGGAVVLTPTVTITSPAGGQFTWASPAAQTASLRPDTYNYGVRLTWGDGTVRTILAGVVTVLAARVV
jgi:hypothetical protein